MNHRQLLTDLRTLGEVRAPATLLQHVVDDLGLGDQYAELATPLGRVFVAWNRLGVSAVMQTATPEEFEARFTQRFGRAPRHAPDGLPTTVGQRFDLRSVTEFERAVLLKAREIPKGEVRTYAWIAAQIGHPAAVRAVGSALRKNPVPVLIPCHRVVRSDGHIGDYALGGSSNKRAILAAEGVQPEAVVQLAHQWRAQRR
ncbi:MAG: MGMT family protein [Chloroflexi bacterium]|nr:MGMT family protein [Chloroflexota bacterium]